MRRDGGVSGSGVPAEPVGRLSAAAVGGAAIRQDAQPPAPAAVRRRRRAVRGGHVPAGLRFSARPAVPAGGGWGHGPMRFSGTAAAGTAVFAAVRRTGGLRTGAGTVGRITHGTAAPHLSGRDELAAAAGRRTLLLFAAASAAGARGTPWRRRTIEDHHICLRTKADRHGAA